MLSICFVLYISNIYIQLYKYMFKWYIQILIGSRANYFGVKKGISKYTVECKLIIHFTLLKTISCPMKNIVIIYSLSGLEPEKNHCSRPIRHPLFHSAQWRYLEISSCAAPTDLRTFKKGFRRLGLRPIKPWAYTRTEPHKSIVENSGSPFRETQALKHRPKTHTHASRYV